MKAQPRKSRRRNHRSRTSNTAALPYVRAALVRGEDDPVWGQAVTAYVVAAPDAPGELDQGIREALRQRLASYKIPKRVISVSALEDITP
jgi:acyl-CoA synthetase (AMP-forming)/AMP-acid ligase II